MDKNPTYHADGCREPASGLSGAGIVIRRTTSADVDGVVAIYSHARAFMAANGNPTQWSGTYPSARDVLHDVALHQGYVCERDGLLVGTFAFILGADPTYRVIEGGTWRSDEPYGTVHRLASGGTCPGVARASFDYCKGRVGYLRADTHADNLPMQGALARNGFVRRGIIHLADGNPRIAYDFVAAPEA